MGPAHGDSTRLRLPSPLRSVPPPGLALAEVAGKGNLGKRNKTVSNVSFETRATSMNSNAWLRRLLPTAIKGRAWELFRRYEEDRLRRLADEMPCVELERSHLKNASLLTDRLELLKELPSGGTVAEIGVDEGEYSAKILELARPATLHLVDAWGSERYSESKKKRVEGRFRGRIADGTVRIHRGLSTEVLPRFEDASFDWVYIDSDHGYRTTAEELRLASGKVKPEGFLAGHDYATGNFERGIRYGVIEAVHEFCVREGWELRFLTAETRRHRSFAITRMEP